MPLASFSSWNQTIKSRPCSGGLNDQQPYSPRQRLGFFMPCDDCAPEGQKHFPPNGNTYALSGRRLLCYPCSPGCYPGLVARCPLSGAHLSERLLLLVIANARLNATELRIRQNFCGGIFIVTFVKKYSNFDPKKQEVLVTKGSFGHKNASFWGFR